MDSAYHNNPPPEQGRTVVFPHVVADIRARAEHGIKKYGRPLETGNGRSALQDAYEEALDLVMYLKQKLLEEREQHGQNATGPVDNGRRAEGAGTG